MHTLFALFMFAASLTSPLRSIVFIQDSEGACSGFVVDASKGWVLTAAHCLGGDNLTVDQVPSYPIRQNDMLALIAIEPQTKPPLDIGDGVKLGEPVNSYGWAYGQFLTLLSRHVAGFVKGDVILDNPIVAGMSGGPVLNQEGKVVGINQASTDRLAMVCGAKEIREFLK